MLSQVLDLDGGVVGETRKLLMQCLHDAHGVRGAVEKIRIAERDMLGSRPHLLPDVLDHHLGLNDPKRASIDRYDRTMPAQMFASPTGFGVTGELGVAADAQLGVLFE